MACPQKLKRIFELFAWFGLPCFLHREGGFAEIECTLLPVFNAHTYKTTNTETKMLFPVRGYMVSIPVAFCGYLSLSWKRYYHTKAEQKYTDCEQEKHRRWGHPNVHLPSLKDRTFSPLPQFVIVERLFNMQLYCKHSASSTINCTVSIPCKHIWKDTPKRYPGQLRTRPFWGC